MAKLDLPKNVFGGPLTTTANTVVYTVPADTTFVTTNIIVANRNGGVAVAVTLKFHGFYIFPAVSVSPNGMLVLDSRIVLHAGETITAWASDTWLDLTVTGVEVDVA